MTYADVVAVGVLNTKLRLLIVVLTVCLYNLSSKLNTMFVMQHCM